MIKRGDKGTIKKGSLIRNARVVYDGLEGDYPFVLAIKQDFGEYVCVVDENGVSPERAEFIPAKPWDSLKPTDPCYVRCNKRDEWGPRVFAGVNESGEPEVFIGQGRRWVFQYLVPAKLINGELVPVEES